MTVTLHTGDCREVLAKMPPKSVHSVITSPPYFNLRDYGTKGQIGLEKSVDAYVKSLVGVFRKVWRVLRDDGTLWLNLGDSFSHGGCGARDKERWPKQSRNDHMAGVRHRKKSAATKPKDMLMVPARLVIAMQAAGWYNRGDVIWQKPNPMTESVKDRPTRSHEYLYLLTKRPEYFYDWLAICEPAVTEVREPSTRSQPGKNEDAVEEASGVHLALERRAALRADTHRRRPGEEARLHQRLWEGGEVRNLRQRLGGDGPHAALVAQLTAALPPPAVVEAGVPREAGVTDGPGRVPDHQQGCPVPRPERRRAPENLHGQVDHRMAPDLPGAGTRAAEDAGRGQGRVRGVGAAGARARDSARPVHGHGHGRGGGAQARPELHRNRAQPRQHEERRGADARHHQSHVRRRGGVALQMSILRRIAAPFAKPLGDYMERWIFRTPWFAVRLHHILRSDADRHFHDHPFDFHSLLLSGGYTEHTPAGTKRWPRFSIVRRRAEDLHRLQLERPVRTLVLAGRKRREWGFATELGWVHWSSYCEKYPEEAGSI